MAEAESNGARGEPAEGQKAPVFHVVAQYIKDLSFENPSAPRTLTEAVPGSGIKIEINVNGRPLSEGNFEVELAIEARAGSDKAVIFNLELIYAGIFRVENVVRESIHPLVMIEGPRLLFPFARHIISDATRNGGFPPLLIDPVDFAALYRQRVAQVQAESAKRA